MRGANLYKGCQGQGQGQTDFMYIETLFGVTKSTTYSILEKIGQKGRYHPIQSLRNPGCQGQGQIDFMPIETLFGLLRSTTYSILRNIGHRIALEQCLLRSVAVILGQREYC